MFLSENKNPRTKRFPVIQFKKDTWEIDEFDCSSCFLLIGSERAMLIDCGIGLGDLRGVIEMLTDKPVTVVITHDHPSHTGNARQFDEIWMNQESAEEPLPYPYDLRRSIVEHVMVRQHGGIGSGMYSAYPLYACTIERDLIEPKEPMPVIHPIEDGMEFDLGGGRIVTAMKSPGHTAGHMMFLDHQSRSLFCGDALNYDLVIGAAPVEETIAYLETMQNLRDQYDGIYNSHHDFRAHGAPLKEDCLPNALELVRQIQSNTYNLIEIPDFLKPFPGAPGCKRIQKYRNFVGDYRFDSEEGREE